MARLHQPSFTARTVGLPQTRAHAIITNGQSREKRTREIFTMIKCPPHVKNGKCAYCSIYADMLRESPCGHEGHLHVMREINDGRELLVECDVCNEQKVIPNITK